MAPKRRSKGHLREPTFPLPWAGEAPALSLEVPMNKDLTRQLELKNELADYAQHKTLSDDDQTKVQGLLEEYDAVTRSIRLDELRAAAGNPSTRTETANDQFTGVSGFNVNKNRAESDPWSQERSAAPAYDRARAVAERSHVPDSVNEHATRDRGVLLVEEWHEDPRVAEWMIAGQDPAYLRAFRKLVKSPTDAALMLTDDERHALMRANHSFRALNEGTGAAGGFLVPPYLDPTIILTNAGTQNPWRSVARVVNIPTQTWKGINSAGVTGEWTAESAEAAAATPSDLAQPTITPVRFDCYLEASYEAIMDTSFTSEISTLVADAVDRLQGTAYAVGTGATQPTGVVTALAGITSSRVNATTNGSFGLVDLYNVLDSLPARARPNASWVAHPKTTTRIRRLAEGVTGWGVVFRTDLTGGTDETRDAPRLLGDPVYLSSDMSSTITSGSNSDTLLCGDFRKSFTIVDRIGTQLAYNPVVIGASRRPIGNAGWFFYGRTGSGIVDGGNSLRMLVQP